MLLLPTAVGDDDEHAADGCRDGTDDPKLERSAILCTVHAVRTGTKLAGSGNVRSVGSVAIGGKRMGARTHDHPREESHDEQVPTGAALGNHIFCLVR
jgi:hypothetical protein